VGESARLPLHSGMDADGHRREETMGDLRVTEIEYFKEVQ
jgi:hypothetical protein